MSDKSTPAAADAERDALRAEVARLGDQVKNMVRTEALLHKVQNALDHQLNIFSKLHELGLKISASFDVKEISALVVNFATYTLGYERCVVFLDHPREGSFRPSGYEGYYGDPWPARIAACRLVATDALPMLVRDKGRVVYNATTTAEVAAAVQGLAATLELAELLSLPIFREGKLLGFLVAGNSAEGRASYVSVDNENSMTGAANLTAQAGSAINSAISHAEVQNERNLLEVRVGERTAELGTALEKLKELDSAKSQFFANVSHELRTPLTLSIAPLEEILHHADRVSLPDRERYLGVVYNNQLRLLKLINNLLDFAKLDAGQMSGAFQLMDLVEAVRFYAGTVSAAAETRGIKLTVDADAPRIPLFLDRDKLEKIVMNLLSNAFKFTPDAGAIAITIRSTDTRVTLNVTDTGIGIPPESVGKLFQRFMQVDSSLKRRYEGTGIGLAMVKDFVAIHGGEIKVESEVGRGSSFIITFKKGSEHLPPETILSAAEESDTKAVSAYQFADFRVEQDEDERDHEIVTLEGPPVEVVPVEALAEVPIHTDGANVLVVDDVQDMRKFISRILSEKYRVKVARDGLEGLEIARRLKPDLIVSDVMMPRMTGYELCSAVRQTPALARTPVILLSAKGDMAGKLTGLEHGADDYLTKPFNADELLTRARNLLRLRFQEKRLFETQMKLLAAQQEARDAEVGMARRVQASILPTMEDFATDGVALSGYLVSATECSGDFWMYRGLDDGRVLVVLADVTGHGIGSAMLTELAYGALNAIIRSGRHLTPSFVLQEVSAILGESPVWMAMAVGIIDVARGTSHWANAAQPPIIIDREGDAPAFVSSQYAPLGSAAADDPPFADIEVPLHGRPRFLLYSDGLLEAESPNGKKPFGLKRLTNAFTSGTPDPRRTLDNVRANVEAFRGGTLFEDDVSAVVVSVFGESLVSASRR